MWLIDQLADKHIIEAIDRGELDNLPGAGKPLQLDDDSLVPEELRAGYRLLKNAGFLPPEMTMRKEIATVEQLLAEATATTDKRELNKRMNFLFLQLNLSRKNSSVWHEDYYAKKLHDNTMKKR